MNQVHKKVAYLATICLLSLYGCVDEAKLPNPALVNSEQAAEIAFPGQSGEQKQGLYFGEAIAYRQIDGQAVFQGDMVLSPADLLNPEQAPDGTGRTLKSLRWTGRIVYYNIDPALPNQRRVTDAIAHWQANTPIRFVPRTNQYSYVTFRPGAGCSSNVGRVGGQQFVTLSTGCTLGNTIHEIGHAVGLYHEHIRADRDRYVTINTANIARGYEAEFRTFLQLGRDGFDQAGGLDFNSVMLYDSYAFSGNGRPTMVKKDGKTFAARRDALSALDIATVKAMYP